MKVSELLTKDPELIRPETSICDAAKKMRDFDVGMLPVCGGDRLVGTITDRDIAIRAIAAGKNPAQTQVKDIMTRKVFYCFEDADLDEAGRIMEKEQVRRLMVHNRQKRLVGIVSLGDLAVRSHDDHLVEEVTERVCQCA